MRRQRTFFLALLVLLGIAAPVPSFAQTPPITITTPSPLPAGTLGGPFTRTLNATGGIGALTWTLDSQGGPLPAGASLSSTGVLSGTPASTGTFNFTVQVRDTANGFASKPLAVTINPAPAITTPSPLPSGSISQPYSQTLSATGGTAPFTWSIASGAPSWLAINSSTGMLGGTPLAGTFSFTATVTDANGVAANRTFALTIFSAPTISTTALPTPVFNQPYSHQFTAGGGAPPYTWSVVGGSLPAGLVFTNSTGRLDGTPTAFGTFSFSVRVTDGNGQSDTKAFSLTVDPPPLTITTATLPDGVPGGAYSANLIAAGGRPPYNWRISTGALPGGLSLDAATGSISGAPRDTGTFNFTVQVNDTAQGTASRALAINVLTGALTIANPSPLPSAVLGTPYNQSFSVIGGTGPYTWSLTSGAPPAGLTLGVTGTLSGTPAALGTAGFTLRVTDTRGQSGAKGFELTVFSGVTIATTSPLSNGTVGTPYAQALVLAGGVAPFTWSVTALPAGLILDRSTGAISGVPSAPGTFDFTVTVIDSARVTASKAFRVTFGVPQLPPVTFPGISDSANPAQQPRVQLALSSGYPLPITGTVTLTFVPDAVVNVNDPAIQFSSGGRTATFQIPANSNAANFTVSDLAVQTGTVAGTISLTTQLQAAGVDITPSPAPSRMIRILRSPPFIRTARLVRTATGFDIQVTGYSTPREMTQALFRFTPAAGANLQTTELTVPVEALFGRYFQDPASANFGSQFSFAQTFTVQGDANAFSSVSVTLLNRQGSSATVAAAP